MGRAHQVHRPRLDTVRFTGRLMEKLQQFASQLVESTRDYVFIRLDAPFKADLDSGGLNLPTGALEYAGSDNASELAMLASTRAAIEGLQGSRTQIVVGVDGGRPSVVSEILSYGVSGLYVGWGISDLAFLEVAYGIADGTGKLPVGLPLSSAATASQDEDRSGDGQDPRFVRGTGIATQAFR